MACQAPPLAALCPVAALVASRDVQACAAPDACPWASVRAAAQKVDSLASFPFLPGLQPVACIVCLDRPAASVALAGRDAALPCAVRFRVLFQELVRDCPLASGEKEWSDVPQQHLVPPPRDARELSFQAELLAVRLPASPSADLLVLPGESV